MRKHPEHRAGGRWTQRRLAGIIGAGFLAFVNSLSLGGCTMGPANPLQAQSEPIVLEEFMGDWFVIAFIPIDIPFASEAGAHNAVESYELNDDGSIDTRYRFRDGSFDGKIKKFNPTGFVHDTETNTEWRMQFVWPFKSAYLIAWVDDRYTRTIIGVPDRKYLWIMARTPDIAETEYAALIDRAGSLGYDTARIRRVPHRWPEPAPD